MKTIIIQLTSCGDRLKTFDIFDDTNTLIASHVLKESLISGVTYSVNDSVSIITLKCSQDYSIYLNVPITTLNTSEKAALTFTPSNTSTAWRHLINPSIYNIYYGTIYPYILEYPFAYQKEEEILQNIKDYTRCYQYLPDLTQASPLSTNMIEIEDVWFNKAILYNGQQCSGLLNLVPKPYRNLQEYMKYPIYNTDSKTILYTKSDNFFQYNTFWSLIKDKKKQLFLSTCESMSIDKILNQDNMDYSKRSFKKEPLRAAFLKVRHCLDNRSDTKLISNILYAPAQISYK